MPESDQDKVKEILDSEGWRIILRMLRTIKNGYQKQCLNPSSPVPVMMDSKSRHNEIERMMYRIGELAGIQGYNPLE